MADRENDKVDPELLKRYEDLDWITVQSSLYPRHEGLKEKLVRKTKENPFVPIGVVATTFALGYGLWSMKQGRSKMSQYMMRFRVVAQGFTIAAIIIGLGISAMKKDEPKR